MNSILQRRSIYKAGNALGAGTVNRTVNLADAADEILVQLAKRTGKTISDFTREAIARGIEATDRAAAMAFRTALDAHSRQRMAAMACLGFVLFIEGLSWAGQFDDEFRRPRRTKTVAVRVCPRTGREVEIA